MKFNYKSITIVSASIFTVILVSSAILVNANVAYVDMFAPVYNVDKNEVVIFTRGE